MYSKNKKKVVVIGGGNGSSITLRALKKSSNIFDISAVISTSDSGGSSGKLREEFNFPPPGDILRAILSLSSIYDYNLLKPIFYKKRFFNTGKLDDHNLGNLFLMLGAKYSGNFINSIRALEQAFECIGKVYPSTLEEANLSAELENGDIIKTEAKIDKPSYDRGIKIKKVWLEPQTKIFTDSAKVIEEADYVVFGPGSLYTSIIASILPDGFREAIQKSKAKLVYIPGNKYELKGETGPTTMCELLATLEEYLPRPIDIMVVNFHKLTPDQVVYYKKRGWRIIEYKPEHIKDTKVIGGDYEKSRGGLDTDKLGNIIREQLL
jgi:uncharacterized cofD-like protein